MFFSKVSIWFRIFCEGSPALECIWSNCDKIVATTQFDLRESFQLMEFLLKKLQTLRLENQIRIHSKEPPFKKCKLTPFKCPDTTTLCTLPAAENGKKILKENTSDPKKPKPHRRPRSHSLSHVKLKGGLVKRSSFIERKTTPWTTTPLPPSLKKPERSPSQSAHDLGYFFTTCINFQKPSNFSNVDDIDWVIRTVAMYGQVLKIQNHWNHSGPKQEWCGAMVTYKSHDDCQQVIRRLHADRFTCLTPLYVPKHLKLIGQMEDRLLKTSLNPEQKRGSTVKVFGIQHRMPSSRRLEQELEQYGDVLSFDCVQDDQDRRCEVWEVTYQYTVEAVAAVLGLDGKFHHRNRLRALLRLGEKELRLNLMVAGHY